MRATVLGFSLFGSLFSATAISDRPPAFGDPLSGLTPTQLAAFADGLDDFNQVETVADGLGPVFNGRACAECHSVPAVGGGSTRTVTRFGRMTSGAFDPMTSFGGSLIQDHAIGPNDAAGIHQFTPEAVPVEATIVAHRRTTPLFGLGFVDAVPDSYLVALAALERATSPQTAGRVNMVTDLTAGGITRVGKLGWKAQNPNLLQFASDAYLNEIGITSPLFPAENCPQGDCAKLSFNPAPGLNDAGDGPIQVANFMSMLAPPPRGSINGQAIAGELVFTKIGCANCHASVLQTGSSSIAALDHKTFRPYSDFLLHDMGSLGDGITQGQATGSDIRTAPRWGLRMVTTFLHDGRATTIDDAILAHDGQGRGARDRFAALDANSKSKLLAFLKSL